MKVGDMVMTPWGAGVIVAQDLPEDKCWRWGVCFISQSVTWLDCWGARHPPSAYFWNSEVAPFWIETTEGEYWDRLCALPPRARGPLGAFLMGDPMSLRGGNETWQAYREPMPGRFEKSAQPITIDEFKGVTNA